MRSRSGQAIVLVALMLVVVIGAVGLAIDGAHMYYESVAAERAAAAGALSGVVFMPGSFATASTRATSEAARNGYSTTDPNVTVTPATVPGFPQELQVTVTHKVSFGFMEIFGVSQGTVSRTAVAGYLSPISIGQPGQQLGSTVSQLGTANNFYYMRSEGWSSWRHEGDPFTPNPCTEFGKTISPCSSDVQTFNGPADPIGGGSPLSLPSRGGQNYLVTIGPGGGYIWIYNAMFAPDFPSPHNDCENMAPSANSGTGHGRTCSSGGNYSMHEYDSFPGSPSASNYSAMSYTIFQVPSLFERTKDVPISTLTLLPVDASNWDPTSGGTPTAPTYKNVNTGATVTQAYTCSPLPCNGFASNMWGVHHWLDPHTYTGAGDGGLVTLSSWNTLPALLPAGTYRVRVDTLNNDGTNPPGSSVAHKGYGVAVSGTAPTQSSLVPTTCSGCTVSAWNDMTLYTPVTGASFSIPIFALPASYAGQTIVIEIYDVGDVGGGNASNISIIDPSGAIATAPAGKKVPIFDLGRQRSNSTPSTSTACNYVSGGSSGEYVNNAPCTVSNGTQATFQSYDGSGNNWYNGHWIHLEIPISSTYNPPVGSQYWNLRYDASGSLTATDTFDIHVALKGAPARLLTS